MAQHSSSTALEDLGCFVNDEWEVRRFSDPHERITPENPLEYDQLGDGVTEWIQDYMVEHYGLEEIWLPTAEVAEASGAPITPSKRDTGKRVRFGSQKRPRSNSFGSTDGDHVSEDGESRSDESESAISWASPPRSGVFTIDEQDLHRVAPEAMIKHARCNIFISRNFWTCEKLLVLIQGSGAVRPGQWSRSLCITHSIHAGSVFDYLKIAQETNMGVLILNPNHNQIKLRVRAIDQPVGTISAQHTYNIKGHDSHIAHITSIYNSFIGPSKARDIYFVAHGRGGDTVLQLLNRMLENDLKTPPMLRAHPDAIAGADAPIAPALRARLRAIAFINSAHSVSYAHNDRVKQVVEERSVNWLASALPLDTSMPEQADNFGCTCVSSGHSKADFTPSCSVNSVFEFFFDRVAPGEQRPDWNPVAISYSNPPQNMPSTGNDMNDANNSGSENDSEVGEPEARRLSRDDFPLPSPRLIEPPLPLHSSTHTSQRRLSTDSGSPHSHDGHSSDDSSNSVRSSSRNRSMSGLEAPELSMRPKEVEMIEMGTQTDPLPAHGTLETPNALSANHRIIPSSARPFQLNQDPPSNSMCTCPLCRVTTWVADSHWRSLLALALVTAGVCAARLYLLHRRAIRYAQQRR